MDQPPESDEEVLAAGGDLDQPVPEVVQGEVIDAAVERVVQIVVSRFSGPLPPPSVLGAYESLSPGLTDRIVEMAEREQAHRHRMDDETVKEETKLGKRGQLFGFIIAIAGLATAVVLGWPAHQGGAAAVVGGASLASLVAAFLKGPQSHPSN